MLLISVVSEKEGAVECSFCYSPLRSASHFHLNYLIAGSLPILRWLCLSFPRAEGKMYELGLKLRKYMTIYANNFDLYLVAVVYFQSSLHWFKHPLFPVG